MSYTMLNYYFRHHDEANPRPAFFDHAAATTILTMGVSAFLVNHPVQILAAGFMSLAIITPTTWWLMLHSQYNAGGKSSNIFYENGVTAEEVERFRQQDAIELAAFHMRTTPGYGYALQNDAKGL